LRTTPIINDFSMISSNTLCCLVGPNGAARPRTMDLITVQAETDIRPSHVLSTIHHRLD